MNEEDEKESCDWCKNTDVELRRGPQFRDEFNYRDYDVCYPCWAQVMHVELLRESPTTRNFYKQENNK